jgi:hypothetical protein
LRNTEVALRRDRAQVLQAVTFAPEKSMRIEIGEARVASYTTASAERLALTDDASRKCSQISDVVSLRRRKWRED